MFTLLLTGVVYGLLYALLILGIIAYTSTFEWLLHRNVMHRPLGKFTYPFKAHAIVHHGLFKADATYHLSAHQNQGDKKTIPMAWWNALFLIPIAASPFILPAFIGGRSVVITAMIIIAAYYGLYEYIHFCMHLPKQRKIECLGIFRRLNGHHVLHHRYMHKNFNVVLPLADWLFGTLLIRSPVAFAQVRGTAVPDVQPKNQAQVLHEMLQQ
ncbi:MAG TPA: sterol desaturase family protein [Candidatus Paceibacterota bacterium]